jgi:hypothetical protein
MGRFSPSTSFFPANSRATDCFHTHHHLSSGAGTIDHIVDSASPYPSTHCRHRPANFPAVEGYKEDIDVLESVHITANLTISRTPCTNNF